MKYFNRSGFSVFLYFVFTAISGTAQAQSSSLYNWQLGLGVGYTNYYGDLSNYRISGFKDFGKLYRFAEYNKSYQHQPSYSLLLQKRLTPTLGFMIQANYMQFEMSDRYRNNNGSFDTTAMNYARSLNFRTTMQDAGIAFTFNGNNGRFFSKTAFFYPSFYLGAGISSFTVKGDLYDENNRPYNYRLPGNIMDGTFETNLRDLRTETDEKYSNVVPYADLGLGLNFRFSEHITLSINSDIKYSSSDYLDDVSRKYKTSYASTQEAYAAKPGYNVVNPLTLQRGDDNGVNDFYINNRVVLNIGLGRSNKNRPQPFVSPVIYSLSAHYNYQKKNIDSVAKQTALHRDSMMRARVDSLVKTRTDSLHALQDSIRRTTAAGNDTGIRKQLQTINSELANIKDLLRSQQSNPRLQKLQYQADSIKALRNKLGQRPAGKEDQLRVRIYDLQADSIRHEMEKVQAGGQYSAQTDTVVRRPVDAGTNDMLSNTPAANSLQEALPAADEDSVTETELKDFNTDISNLKKDKRYKTNAAFKSDVDSLQRKVNTYPVIKNNTKSRKTQVQQVQASQLNAAATSADHARMDSLQQRVRDLEEKINNGSAARNNSIDTVTQTRVVTDTVYDNKSINQLQARMQENKDSLDLLQRRLKQSNDSAAYFRRAAYAANDNQVVVQETPKRKWYQLFGSRKPKPQADAAPAITNQNTTRQYDDMQRQLSRTQDSVAYYQKAVSTTSGADQKAAQQQYDNMERQLRRSEDSIANYQKALAATNNTGQQAAAPKRKWYQFYGSGKKKQQAAAVVPVTGDQNASQQRYNELQLQLKRTQDSIALYQKALAAPGNVDEQTPAPKKKWYQFYGSDKKKKQNAAAMTSDQRAAQQRYDEMQLQLKRTQDSIALYQKALASPYNTNQEATTPKRKWYQIFGSGKRNKKQTDKQVNNNTNPALQQQNIDRQQQYYNDEISRMQRNIDDINRRNSDLTNEYNRLQADRNRVRRDNLSTLSAPVVVADGSTTYRTPVLTKRQQKAAVKAELTRMRLQNYQAQRSALDNTYLPAPPVPPLVVQTPVRAAEPVQASSSTDTAGINALRSEIEQLRSELNAIKTARPALADTVRTDRNFDVNSFPVISVYFNTGAVTLSSDQVSKITRFAQVAAGNASARVLLKGFSDPVGNATANTALARKRTDYVKNLLISRFKVDESRIIADEPTVASGGKVKKPNPLDRRVDLEFR